MKLILRNVIFFGSRARGEGVLESDYDFLIALDEVSPKSKDTIDEIVGALDQLYQNLKQVIELCLEGLSEDELGNLPEFIELNKSRWLNEPITNC